MPRGSKILGTALDELAGTRSPLERIYSCLSSARAVHSLPSLSIPQYVMEGGGGGTNSDVPRLRATASRRLLEQHAHASSLSILGGGIGPTTGAHWPPSRRREEARALENLQRRVNQGQSPVRPRAPAGTTHPSSTTVLDNRPHLLQKVGCINMSSSFKIKLIYQRSPLAQPHFGLCLNI